MLVFKFVLAGEIGLAKFVAQLSSRPKPVFEDVLFGMFPNTESKFVCGFGAFDQTSSKLVFVLGGEKPANGSIFSFF